MRDPFRKLHANIRISGARSQRARKDTRPSNPVRDISITPDDLRRKYEEQNGCCHWTGMPLEMERIFTPYDMAMPSVDRLDPDQGYHYENIVLTTRFLNVGRGRMSIGETVAFLTRLRGDC